MTLVTMTGTTVVFARTIPGTTTTSVRSPAVGREAVGRMEVRREVPASYSISYSDISPDNFIRAYNPYFLCRLLFYNKELAC